MDRLRLPFTFQAQIGLWLLGALAYAQTNVLKKPNTFTVLSFSQAAGDTAAVIS